MKTTSIIARDLGDAWFQTLYKILEEGYVYTIDRGSYAGQKRLEFDWVTIQIKQPWTLPLVPKIPAHYGIPDPCSEDYLYGQGEYKESYIEYLMSGEVKEGESYTYGQRLTRYPISNDYLVALIEDKGIIIKDDIWTNGQIIEPTINNDNEIIQYYLNQIELLIWTYKNKGYRNNQMVLQIAHPTDMLLTDPPCLRSIDTRIQDGALHFYPYFRSWDLFNGFPANLAAIENLKQYCASCIGVENGEIIATSKGLHVYDYAFDMVKVLRMKEDIELKEGTN